MAGIKCSVCFKEDEKLKSCGRCLSVFYCSPECQKSDWKSHKQMCKKKEIVQSKTHSVSLDGNSKRFLLGQCESCEKVLEKMKACQQCLSVLYCSKECQKSHWKYHRSYCLAKKAIKGNNSPTDENFNKDMTTEGQENDKKNGKKQKIKKKREDLSEVNKEWKEIQKFGFQRGRQYRKEELDAGRSPRDVINSHSYKMAINEAKDRYPKSVVITDFRAIPMELSAERKDKIILIAQMVSWHPEAARHGMFIVDVNDVTSFVLFDPETVSENPKEYFYWSDINPGNYILIKQAYLRVFPEQFLGFVVENACHVDTVLSRPWMINRLGKYMLTLNVYNGIEPEEKEN